MIFYNNELSSKKVHVGSHLVSAKILLHHAKKIYQIQKKFLSTWQTYIYMYQKVR